MTMPNEGIQKTANHEVTSGGASL